MRLITITSFAILGLALCFFVAPESTTAQQGKKGQGGGFGDPGARFDQMSNNRAAIPVNEVQTRSKELLLKFVQEKGITNGQITKQQYIEYTEYAKANGGFNMFGGGGKGKGANPTGDPNAFKFKMPGKGDAALPTVIIPGSGPAQPPEPNGDLIKKIADESFKSLDANGDGKLNQDEMPAALKSQLEKWDKNKDGFIDLDEYRAYFVNHFSGGAVNLADENNKSPDRIIDDDELDRKAVVFRVGGKTPPGLPGWFKDLDKDPADGQIALNEWRAAGKDLDDFKTWDLNDDGFITMEEAAKVNLSLNASGGVTKGGTKGGANGEMPAFKGFGGKKKKNGGGG